MLWARPAHPSPKQVLRSRVSGTPDHLHFNVPDCLLASGLKIELQNVEAGMLAETTCPILLTIHIFANQRNPFRPIGASCGHGWPGPGALPSDRGMGPGVLCRGEGPVY